MYKKRGQITLIIIIGIFLVIVFSLVYFIIRGTTETKLEEKQELVEKGAISFEPIRELIETCLQQSAEDALYTASRQGGLLHPEKLYDTILLDDIYQVPIYVDCGDSLVPSLEVIEQDLSSSIRLNFLNCFEESKQPLEHMDIQYSKAATAVDISFNFLDTSVRLNFPVEAQLGITRHRENKFSAKIDIPFWKMYDATNKLIEKTMSEEGLIEMSNHFGLNIEGFCPSLVQSPVNLFIKPQEGYTDLIQFVSYTRIKRPSAKNYIFQFATNNMNFANNTGCINVADEDMDGAGDGDEFCRGSSTTVVDFNGCACGEKECGQDEICVNSDNSPVCVDPSEVQEKIGFYDRLKDYEISFSESFTADVDVLDCAFETDRCPYERCCEDGCYFEAREDWRDECRLGEILVNTSYQEDRKYLCCKSNVRGSEDYAYHTTLFTWNLLSKEEDCKDKSKEYAEKQEDHYPLRKCGYPCTIKTETSFCHDPDPDPSGIYGMFRSVHRCFTESMEACASNESFNFSFPYFLSPYDDEDDAKDCPVIEKTQTDIINAKPVVDSLFGEDQTYEEFILEFRDLVDQVLNKNHILSVGPNSKIGNLLDRLEGALAVDSRLSSINESIYGLSHLKNNITRAGEKLQVIPLDAVYNTNISEFNTSEQIIIITDLVNVANVLNSLNNDIPPYIEDADALFDMILGGAPFQDILNKIQQVELVDRSKNLIKQYENLNERLDVLDKTVRKYII